MNDATRLNPLSFQDGFTQSEIVTMDNCPEKWYRGYNSMLRKRGTFQWYNVYGSAVHASLESFYTRLDGTYELATLQIPADCFLTAADETKLRYYTELLRVQMERYAIYWADDFTDYDIQANEQIITVEHQGLILTGKLDLIWAKDDKFGPADHKTSGLFTPEIFAGWNFRFQFMFYAWLWWQFTGEKPNCIWWNGIKKPMLKQGKNESFESFMVRISGDMRMEPDKYLKRQDMPLEDGMLEHFEARILQPKLDKLKLLTDATTSGIIIESLARNMNTSECVRFGKTCEFIELCKHGIAAEGHGYITRETKHEELEVE